MNTLSSWQATSTWPYFDLAQPLEWSGKSTGRAWLNSGQLASDPHVRGLARIGQKSRVETCGSEGGSINKEKTEMNNWSDRKRENDRWRQRKEKLAGKEDDRPGQKWSSHPVNKDNHLWMANFWGGKSIPATGMEDGAPAFLSEKAWWLVPWGQLWPWVPMPQAVGGWMRILQQLVLPGTVFWDLSRIREWVFSATI